MVCAPTIRITNNLRQYREARNLPIVGLAVLSNASPTTISVIEKWNHEPSDAVKQRIASALGVSIAEIWPPEEPAA